MEIHRELGKGHDEVIYKDALVVELMRAGIPFSREKLTDSHLKQVLNYLAGLETSRRPISQFRRRCVGMETGNYSGNRPPLVQE